MSDELRRRFQDKIQGRAHGARRPQAGPPAEPAPGESLERLPDEEDAERFPGQGDLPRTGAAAAPEAPMRILRVEHGAYPEISALNADFSPGRTRVRMTLDLGPEVRRQAARFGAAERDGLLSLCPRLPQHECSDGRAIGAWLFEGEPPAIPVPGRADGEVDGLLLAHLIEHVAIDLMVAASGSDRCGGLVGAHREGLSRFDVYLEGPDAPLVRAVAILAAAAVRDLCLGLDRLPAHRRCRDLLEALATSGQSRFVADDLAARLGWTLPETLAALEALGRLGYLDSVPAPFTFSSSTGVLFRRLPA